MCDLNHFVSLPGNDESAVRSRRRCGISDLGRSSLQPLNWLEMFASIE